MSHGLSTDDQVQRVVRDFILKLLPGIARNLMSNSAIESGETPCGTEKGCVELMLEELDSAALVNNAASSGFLSLAFPT